MTHHTPHSARETLLSNTVLSTEQVEQDDVLYVGVFGGLNIVTAGNAECAEDDSEHGLTDTECVVGERGLRRKLEGTLHAGQRCQGQDKTDCYEGKAEMDTFKSTVLDTRDDNTNLFCQGDDRVFVCNFRNKQKCWFID